MLKGGVPLSLCLPSHSSATQATSAPNHSARLRLPRAGVLILCLRCTHPLPLPSPLHPPHLGVAAEAAALALEPRKGRRPPPAPRPAPQGNSCEKQGGRRGGGGKRRREGRWVREGGGESCAFLQAERASPRRGPSPRSCLPSPGPPTWQQQHRHRLLLLLLLCSPAARLGAAPHCGSVPSCGPAARYAGLWAGFRWETPTAWGFRASRTMM